jgi:ribonuclease P protein component
MRIARAITSFTSSEIRRLIARAQVITSDQFITLKCVSTDNEIGRILIVVPKRVGSAPIRNTIKRQVRSIFYQYQLYQRGKDFVIFFHTQPPSFAYLKKKLCIAL